MVVELDDEDTYQMEEQYEKNFVNDPYFFHVYAI
jgi:hypothetical protein